MKFNEYSGLEGTHAFLSPSSYHWVNYDDDKLLDRYANHRATVRGVELHEFASMAIKHRVKLAKIKNALNQFVNDSIGFNMESEKILFYSEFAYGTTDAISFKDGVLRIFDYKSGKTKASPTQLEIYAALFCLEYYINPYAIEIILRIYQYFDYEEFTPTPDRIRQIMEKIIHFDKLIRSQEG